MRTKSILLLALALGCGTIASIGITQVMAKWSNVPSAPKDKMQSIFVALEDIGMGDPIDPATLKLEDWPRDKVPDGAITKLEDIEGRRPKSRILKGMPVLSHQLLAKGASGDGLTSQIPKGFRVVTVKVDDVSSLSSMIRPGDRVDVVVHFKQGDGIPQTMTKTILQDIKIAAVNSVYELEKATGEKKVAAKTVSVLVTPRQGETLTLAESLGKVRLLMRSFEDAEQAATSEVTINDLLNAPNSHQEESPAPAPAQNSQFSILDLVKAATPSPPPEPAAKPQPAAPAPAKPVSEGPKEPGDWTTRVISPVGVQDVVMEPTSPSGKPTAGAEFWRVTAVVAQPAVASAGHSSPQPPPSAPSTDSKESDSGQGSLTPASSGKAPADGSASATDSDLSSKDAAIFGSSESVSSDDKQKESGSKVDAPAASANED